MDTDYAAITFKYDRVKRYNTKNRWENIDCNLKNYKKEIVWQTVKTY